MDSDFSPSTAFEGWIKKAIEELERRIGEHSKTADERWANHLFHHEKLENSLIKYGILLSGLSLFLGWVIRSVIR